MSKDIRKMIDKVKNLGKIIVYTCVDGDYDKIREYHKEMGCVCYENHSMGLYFINDPDDYWIEVLPINR